MFRAWKEQYEIFFSPHTPSQDSQRTFGIALQIKSVNKYISSLFFLIKWKKISLGSKEHRNANGKH